MSIILPRRQFLTGLFAAPAVVAATSLMPIKPVSAGIFKLEKYTEIPSFDKWCLVNENGGNYAWMMESYVDSWINPLEVIKKVNMSPAVTIREKTKLEVDLMKNFSAKVITDIPSSFLKGKIYVS